MFQRYCFIADNPHWEEKVAKIYSDINATVTKMSSDEGCVVLNDNDIETLLEHNDTVSKLPGISRPIYVPLWKKIINNGPYVTEDHYELVNQKVVNARTKKEILLDRVSEQALYSYDKDNESPTYHVNFKTDLKRVTGINIADVDLSQLKPQRRQNLPNIVKFGYVVIDGTEVPLSTFATPPTIVNTEGHILVGVTKRDIVLNSEKSVPGFKTVFIPGASWSAKWNTPSYVGRIFIQFKNKVEEEEDLALSEASQYSRPASQISDYAVSEDEEEGEEEGEGGYIPKGGKYAGPLARVPFGQMEDIVLSETDKPDFVNLTEEERNYLPLSYILSQAAQWRILLKALTSNFTNIAELPKVNDYTLGLVADSIAYSLSKGIMPLPASIAILKYAEKREKPQPEPIIIDQGAFRITDKIAAFDYDSTLVKTKSGNPFPANIDDWTWFRSSVPQKLIDLYKQGFCIMIFTNQSKDWKIDQIQLALSTVRMNGNVLPVRMVIARDKILYKPNPELFYKSIGQFNERDIRNILSKSIFVGDALGRSPNDYSDSDLVFGTNVGFATISAPEDVFPAAAQNPKTFPLSNKQEIVVLVGYPGSGKTTFVNRTFSANDRYKILHGDDFKTAAAMISQGKKLLQESFSVVFDATNPTVEKRSQYIQLARSFKIPTRCIYLATSLEESLLRNNLRIKPIPKVVFFKYRKNFIKPTVSEGFSDVVEIV